VEALVVSTETVQKALEINKTRSKRSLQPLIIITVPMMRAEDGKLISSTRIREGEIDYSGKLLKVK
jgi:pantetheine-phosphate adenylyltransferase